jgi:hypothetical protein
MAFMSLAILALQVSARVILECGLLEWSNPWPHHKATLDHYAATPLAAILLSSSAANMTYTDEDALA